MIGLDGGFLSCAFVWRGQAGAWLCLWWVKPRPARWWRMDGVKLQGPRENVPAAPSGNSKEMIHFQHRFTQDDLITLCEWTVLSMRTWQASRVQAEPGTCAVTRHPSHDVWRQYYRNRTVTTHFLGGHELSSWQKHTQWYAVTICLTISAILLLWFIVIHHF